MLEAQKAIGSNTRNDAFDHGAATGTIASHQRAPTKIPATQATVCSSVITTHLFQPGYIYRAKRVFSRFRKVMTDQTRRAQFEQTELDTLLVKCIVKGQRHNNCNTVLFRPRLCLYEAKLGRNTFLKPHGTVTRIRNRCVISGRSSILGSTGFSRICFRRRAGLGKVPGLLKI